MIEYKKVKSAAKRVTPHGQQLSSLVLSTLRTVSDVVGATLGPGGRSVLIERAEHDLPPMVTKDGVTVFRSLGFEDATQQCLMEAARDASVRTAQEAGDGTTTATILAEAIVRYTNDFCAKNPKMSPQRVVRRLEDVFRAILEPRIRECAVHVDTTSAAGKALLRSVAKVSANGDEALADAVMQCFDIVGDEGNVTITEVSGPSSYEVEEIDGYPIPIGYEDSTGKFYPKFINDPGRQLCVLENPVFVLYHGTISDVQTLYSLLSKVANEFERKVMGDPEWSGYNKYNVVVAAIGFSEQVLGTLAAMFPLPNAINVFPLVVPKSPLANGQAQFLADLSAITGATVFDPINKPMDSGSLEDLGPGVTAFEAGRFRSAVIGRVEEEPYYSALLDQVSTLQALLERPESELDKILLQERLGKLTGGIAKLKVIGASNGELKEKRDRAEDAVCAVRGAIKHGCLPGGCWTLLRLVKDLESDSDDVISKVLIPALREPLNRLLSNAGLTSTEVNHVQALFSYVMEDSANRTIYDAFNHAVVDAFEAGILDSVPAVLEAVRNSVSIASLLGTLGGTVVFGRDNDLERSEARDTAEWLRNANVNEANERA